MEMEETTMTPQDYGDVLKRRKLSLIVPALIVFLAAVIIALVLPPIYKSTSTILIEEQEIPVDLVMTTVTSYAEQRLQVINQRIMSTSRLQEIINRFDIYQDLRDRWTTEEIIEKMREDIQLEPINVEVVDRRTGRPSSATIAFTLSYEGENDPVKVQRVANVLASLYLEENLKVRERQVTEASSFFEDEIERVKGDLNRLEQKIAAFKVKHVNELPELLQVNVQSLNNIAMNIERANEQLRSFKEKEGYLQSQLASVSPQMEDQQRLEDLKLQLTNLKTRFSDEYPDVIQVKAEIAELEKQLSDSDLLTQPTDERPDNPAYINLASQLASIQSEIESVERQRRDLEKQKEEFQRRVAITSTVEGEYRSLVSERDSTQAKHDDLMRKFMETKVAQGLEKEQKGERFTLIDPAVVAEKPYKPNRLAIMLIGLVLGIGAGIGFASFKEFSDDAVWKAETLTEATSFPVLVTIPDIRTEQEKADARGKRKIRLVVIAILLIVGLALFHFFVMDFDIFWAKVMRRMAL